MHTVLVHNKFKAVQSCTSLLAPPTCAFVLLGWTKTDQRKQTRELRHPIELQKSITSGLINSLFKHISEDSSIVSHIALKCLNQSISFDTNK